MLRSSIYIPEDGALFTTVASACGDRSDASPWRELGTSVAILVDVAKSPSPAVSCPAAAVCDHVSSPSQATLASFDSLAL